MRVLMTEGPVEGGAVGLARKVPPLKVVRNP
jgi:RNA polymerase sigma-70 factor (ECF subfamily)